jgi:hypothetical protein
LGARFDPGLKRILGERQTNQHEVYGYPRMIIYRGYGVLVFNIIRKINRKAAAEDIRYYAG